MSTYFHFLKKRFVSNKGLYFNLIFSIAIALSFLIVVELNNEQIRYSQILNSVDENVVDLSFTYRDNDKFPYQSLTKKFLDEFPNTTVYNSIDYTVSFGLIASSPNIDLSEINDTLISLPYNIIGVDSYIQNHLNVWDFISITNNSQLFLIQNSFIIDDISAKNYNLSIGDVISLGNIWTQNETNYSTYIQTNLVLVGIYSISDYLKFCQAFLLNSIISYNYENPNQNIFEYHKAVPKLIFLQNDFDQIIKNLVPFSLTSIINFGIILDRSQIVSDSLQNSQFYLHSITLFIDQFQITYFNENIKYSINEVENSQNTISVLYSILMIPIIIFIYFIIKMNIQNIEKKNFREIAILQSRGTTSIQLFKLYLLENMGIGISSAILSIILGLIFFRLSINSFYQMRGISINYDTITIIQANIPSLILYPLSIGLILLSVAGYSYLKKVLIIQKVSLNEYDSFQQSEEKMESRITQRFQKLAIIFLFILLGLNLFESVANSMNIRIFDTDIGQNISILNQTFSLLFPIIPILLFYLIIQLFSNQLIQKIRNGLGTLFSKNNLLHRFFFQKIHITTQTRSNRTLHQNIMIFFGIGLSFSIIFSMIIQNQTVGFNQKKDYYLGGDSHLTINRSEYNLNTNDSKFVEDVFLNNSQMNFDQLTCIFRQNQNKINGMTLCSSEIRDCFRQFDFFAFDVKKYIQTYDITQEFLTGGTPEVILSRLQNEPNSILISQEALDYTTLEINDTISYEYKTLINNSIQELSCLLTIIGGYNELPGMVSYVNSYSAYGGIIIDYNNVMTNFDSIPKWDMMSVLVKYVFPEGDLSPDEQYNLIKNSEKGVINELTNNGFHVDKQFDSLYNSYSSTLKPILEFIKFEQYMIYGISLLSLIFGVNFILNSKKHQLIQMQIKGINSKSILRIILFEGFVISITCILFNLLSIPFGLISNYFFESYIWTSAGLYQKSKFFTLSIPFGSIFISCILYGIILFGSYLISYKMWDIKNNRSKIGEELRMF